MRKCNNCGYIANDNCSFCSKCGNNLDTNSPSFNISQTNKTMGTSSVSTPESLRVEKKIKSSGKFESCFKKSVAIMMIAFMASPVLMNLTACGQKNPPTTEPPKQEEVLPGGQEVNPGVEVVEKISVADVLDAELLEEMEYKQKFNQALISAVGHTYQIGLVNNIDIKEFTIGEEGKIVLEVTYRNTETMLEDVDEVEYVGDTSGFDVLYGLAYNNSDFIEKVVTEAGATLNGEIEKDGEVHDAIVDKFDLFTTQQTAFAQISFEKVNENTGGNEQEPGGEAPPEVEMVTVQSVVDEVFAGVNFTADLKGTLQSVVNSVASGYEILNLKAVDYDAQSISFYGDMYYSGNESIIFTHNKIQASGDNFEYIKIVKDLNGYIENKIAAKGLTVGSEIDKNSADYTSLLAEIQAVKTLYDTQKAALNTATLTFTTGLCVPKQFTPQELQTLGITSTNAFAEALLVNQGGVGFDQVTGWGKEDIVETFFTEFGGESLSGDSAADAYVVTKNGIYKYRVNVTRDSASQDKFAIVLEKNDKTSIIDNSQLRTFSTNAIFFDADGNIIEFETVTTPSS